MRRLAIVGMFVLVTACQAADLKLVGERQVSADKFADFMVEGHTENVDYFVYPIPPMSVERGGGISFSRDPKVAVYVIKATVVDFNAKKVLKSDLVPVTFGIPIPPGPPDPPEPPPLPEDPFIKGLREEVAKISPAEDKARVTALSEMYRAGAKAVEDKIVKSWTGLRAKLGDEAASRQISGRLANVQKYIIETKLSKAMPKTIDPLDDVFTADKGRAAQQVLTEAADALDKVARNGK
jgi:hypothetical protein